MVETGGAHDFHEIIFSGIRRPSDAHLILYSVVYYVCIVVEVEVEDVSRVCVPYSTNGTNSIIDALGLLFFNRLNSICIPK